MKYCPKCERDYPTSERLCSEDGASLSLRDPYHLVGQTLADKYRIEALVGLGGMGAVYRAYHSGIDRQVACKILQPNIAVGAEGVVELFEREAKIAGRLEHKNIVDIKDAGRTKSGIAYIIMEWLEGQTLSEVLSAEGGIELHRTNDLLQQIAAALDCAHAAQIVHRDLKPGNIMLLDRGEEGEQVKILDFGIGKIFDETLGARVSNIMGTPHYASPEQLELGGWIDGRSDLYSLGVILFQMLSGRLPFEAQSITQVIQLHLASTPPRLREVRPEMPEAIDDLVAQLLAKDPEERPTSAGETAMAFSRAIGAWPADPTVGENLTARGDDQESRSGVRARAATVAARRSTRTWQPLDQRTEQETAVLPTPVKPVEIPSDQGGKGAFWRRSALVLLGFGVFGVFGYGVARWNPVSNETSAPKTEPSQTAVTAVSPTPGIEPSPTPTRVAKAPAKVRSSPTPEPPPDTPDPRDPRRPPRPYPPPPDGARVFPDAGGFRGEYFRPRREPGRESGRGASGGAEAPPPMTPEMRTRIIANSHLVRARVYFDQGDYRNALAACNEAIRIEPGNQQAIALRQRLRKLLGEPENR